MESVTEVMVRNKKVEVIKDFENKEPAIKYEKNQTKSSNQDQLEIWEQWIILSMYDSANISINQYLDSKYNILGIQNI